MHDQDSRPRSAHSAPSRSAGGHFTPPPPQYRSHLGRSLSLLPLLALLLGAFSLFAPAPAEARTILWSGTLTVGTGSNEYGCGSSTGSACSAQLTTDSLTIDGREYVITRIVTRNWNSPVDLRLGLTRKNPEAGQLDRLPGKDWARLTLQLDGKSFSVPDAFEFNDEFDLATHQSWNNPGISWTAGQKVQVSVFYNDLPSAPRNFRATRGDDQVTLNWDVPSSWGDGTAGRYEIQWRPRNNFASSSDRNYRHVFRNIVDSSYYPEASASSFVFSGRQRSGSGITLVTDRNPYDFRIRAISAEPAAFSDWVEVISEATAPHAAPPSLRVTSGIGQLRLDWDANRVSVPGRADGGPLAVTGFDVHYTSVLDRGLVPDTWQALDNPPGFQYPSAGWVPLTLSRRLQDFYVPSDATYTISGLTDGTTYRVRVRARNDAGGGEWAFVTGTTSGTAPAVVVPAPAEPQTTLWSTTLTVDQTSGFSERLGCDNDSNQITDCDAALTTDRFSYEGYTVFVNQIEYRSDLPRLEFHLGNVGGSGGLGSNWRRLTLHFGGKSFPLANAQELSTNRAWRFSNAGLGWTNGQRVQIRLTYKPPTVSLSASPNPVREGSPVTVTATLSYPLSEDVSIPIAAASVANEITIVAGQTTGTYVHTAGDAPDGEKIKREQMVVLNRLLKRMTPAITLGDPYLVNVQVLDENADPPKVSVSDANGHEQLNNFGRLCFEFTLDRAASHEVWVNYWTEDGTAKAWQDYAGKTSLSLGFAPGETRKSKCISIIDDGVEDSGETFYVVLGNPPEGAILGRDRGTGTIYNHEPTSLSALTAEGASAEDGPFTALDIGTFAPAKTTYAATVPHGTTHARLTATSLNRYLTITTGLDGKGKSQVPFGGGTGPAVALAVGENVLVVKTQFNGQRQTYRVTVTREAEPQGRPTVASAIADISSLEVGASQLIPLSGVFTDPEGDALTLSAVSSSDAVVTVLAQLDPVTASATAITVTGVASGTATITVTARDSDGNSVSDAFEVTVPATELLQQIARPGPVIDLTLAAGGDKVVVSWTAPELGSAPKGYIVHLKPEGGETGSGKTKRPKAKKTKVTYNRLEAGVTYNVWVRAQNEVGKGARVYETITVAAPQPTETAKAKAKTNSAPTVASEIADLSGLRVDNTRNVSLAGVFTDADGDALTITASSSNDGVATATVNGQSLTVSAKREGTATITVSAADGKGGSVSDAFSVTVAPKPNRAPTVASALGALSGLRAGDARQVSLAGVFTDSDGDPLTITAYSTNNAVATATVNGQSLTISARQAGTATITVTASDGKGGSVFAAFSVTVEANVAPQPEPEPEQVDTPEPEPEQEQQQESGAASDSDLPAIVQAYDQDGSGKIESGEWALAMADYVAQKLTTPQIQVIAGYRG